MKTYDMSISKIKYSFSSILVVVLTYICGFGQSSDSVIFSAMRDELKRNIEQLSADVYEKPFFIAYSIADINNTVINASLGALNGSETRKYKDWQVRVMVGDYEINDENFKYDQPQENIFKESRCCNRRS